MAGSSGVVRQHRGTAAKPTSAGICTDRPLGAVLPSEVQAWVKALSIDLPPATVEVVYRYLVSMYAPGSQSGSSKQPHASESARRRRSDAS
jgi:hypothetical protein